MLTISKPISAGQAQTYHAEHFSNASESYYTDGAAIQGQWHGALADHWHLTGNVDDATFRRLAQGRDPLTDVALVRHRQAANAMDHRAGYDATFSAPKSVSLVALVGGDTRVRDAHRASVALALRELEPYAQARVSKHEAQTTGNVLAAVFEHDSDRPVNGVSAPQLHSHAVIFNLTRTAEGTIRPLQPRELYRSQQFVTAVYRSDLTLRLQALGYEVTRGQHNQPEITGISEAYRDASSPRRKEIVDRMAELGLTGAGAAQTVALQTRGKKLHLTPQQVRQQHAETAALFGNEAQRTVATAQIRDYAVTPASRTTAEAAVFFSRDRNIEREAVVDARALLRDALIRSMGDRTVDEIKAAFAQRTQDGTFVAVQSRPGSPVAAYTTPAMLALERENIARMLKAQSNSPVLAAADIRRDIQEHYPGLTDHVRTRAEHLLVSPHQIQALDGPAGSLKTTLLATVRDAVEREGYVVHGMAPTSKAAKLMEDAQIPSMTLQRYLVAHPDRSPGKNLYVLDESSLASTPQVHQLLERLHPDDRILLVGDARQHEAVDAGAPYRQLVDTGIYTTRLEEIVRQQDPALKAVVERLARGETTAALASLDQQGRIHEVPVRRERYRAIADAYLQHPASTLVVAPDNQSRTEINQFIHRAGQQAGLVQAQDHPTRVLVNRNDLTGPDRQWAARYEPGDVLRYSRGSEQQGIKAGDYARVLTVDPTANTLRVRLDRQRFSTLTYDPRRLQGVTVFREAERAFSVGDRVQFTAPDKALKVANRELGTVQRIDTHGIAMKMDDGRRVTAPDGLRRHLDHGYCMTSYSSQGQTADYVLFHADTTDRVSVSLSNQRLAYVALSRSRIDATVFTDSKERLPQVLSREVHQQTALQAPEPTRAQRFGR